MKFYYCERHKIIESERAVRDNCDLSPDDEWDDVYADCPDCAEPDMQELTEEEANELVKLNPKIQLIK